ncbi:hypothetical protein LGAA44_80001 [Leuconostoc gasicomitatum]|nr:hypothetical protein LGAA44_80001 [Leuconostoc gasicomitatum]
MTAVSNGIKRDKTIHIVDISIELLLINKYEGNTIIWAVEINNINQVNVEFLSLYSSLVIILIMGSYLFQQNYKK